MQGISALVLTFLLLACSPIVNHRGHTEKDKFTNGITVGTDTKADVRSRFGSPSSMSKFGEETWYYVSVRKETRGFFRPEITQQDITQIMFNAEGVVSDMKQYTKSDSEQVVAVEQITPTEGHSLGFMEQIFGNIGRFNKDRTTTAPSRRPGGRY